MCYLEGSLSEPGLLEAAHLLFAVDCEQLLLPAPLHSQYAEDNGAAAEVVRCILQMQCNNFTAVDYYGKFVAEVCDPVTALMNHSCAPNAAVAWHCPARPGEHICHTVRCLEPLNPGDEVLISYVDTGQPWWSRQAALQSVHGFSCVCLVCHDIQRSVNGCRDNSRSASTATIRSSLQRIENASGQIMPYALRDVAGLRHFICEGLGASVAHAGPEQEAALRAAEVLMEATDFDHRPTFLMERAEVQQRFETSARAAQTLRRLVGPQHYFLKRLYRLAVLAELCGDWPECERAAAAALDAFGARHSVQRACTMALHAKAAARMLQLRRREWQPEGQDSMPDLGCQPFDDEDATGCAVARCREALVELNVWHGAFAAHIPDVLELNELLHNLLNASAPCAVRGQCVLLDELD